jgi:hypothetical protein
MTKSFRSLLHDYPSLPISNIPLLEGVSKPPLEDTTPLRHRFKGPRVNYSAEGHRDKDKASSSEPILSTLDNRKKEHNGRIEALRESLVPMLAENGSTMVLLCWGE